MSGSYKFVDQDNRLYFITMTVVEHIPVFTDTRYLKILIDNFKFYREKQGLRIHFYILMDNHCHAVVSHPDRISRIVQNYKSYTAGVILDTLQHDQREWILLLLEHYKKRYKNESRHQFWDEGSHPILIQSNEMLAQKADYIHWNPVKRGLVREPEDWLYSSAGNSRGKEAVLEMDPLPF
jgi:REP element-mobilizing transposase RayT